MNFLIDNQLPPALARFIRDELHASATYVADVGMRDASDKEVWIYASKNDMVLVSKDEDFANTALQAATAKLI